MPDAEASLMPVERLAIAALYARLTAVTPSPRLRLDSGLTSLDVLHPAQHNAGDVNTQVEVSHILVSNSLSHNQSHKDVS